MPAESVGTTHGIAFTRTGRCTRCGKCCLGCSHHLDEGAARTTCAIYATRDQYCAEHGETHQMCIDFPTHPWLRVLKTKVCGYTVQPANLDDALRITALENTWGTTWLLP